MDPITLAIAFGTLAALGSRIPKTQETPEMVKQLEADVKARLKDATLITVPPENEWPTVEYNGAKYLVAPRYIAPVGIGEAQAVAQKHGYELPTIGLVDAIYKAADLKLDPHERGVNSKPPSDFTGKTMNSAETHIAQLAAIQKQIETAGNPEYRLLAGTHKDVVFDKIPFGKDAGKMHLGIYGWHRRNGKPIQDFMWGHSSNYPADDWKDYSQGVRLVKRIG